jgi:galactonate dehydratase
LFIELDYLQNPEVFNVKDGYVERRTLPGLGIQINEEKVREMARQGHDWKNPIWRNEDGSITEW